MSDSPKRGRPKATPEEVIATSTERFWKGIPGVADPNKCWSYFGHKLRLPEGKMVSPKRFSYILQTGNIPHGYEVKGGCKTSNCVNWNHLRLLPTGDPIVMQAITTPLGLVVAPERLPSDADLLALPDWTGIHWREREKMLEAHNKFYPDDARDLNVHITEAERLYA